MIKVKKIMLFKLKYGFVGKRYDKEMLFRYMVVFYGKVVVFDMEFWCIGVCMKISEIYSLEFEYDVKVKFKEVIYDWMMFMILISCVFLRGRLIVENVVWGIFLSYKKNEYVLDIDFGVFCK